MASPLPSEKKSVDMTAPVVRVSRIRRDPPLKVKPVSAAEIKEREARNIVIGVMAFALALFVILMAINDAAGWSPSQYSIDV